MPSTLRQSMRRLAGDWRFSVTAAATLAFAIAANTVVFGAAYAVLWRPLPMANAERLLVLWNGYPSSPGKASVAAPEFFEYRDQLRSFAALAAVRDYPVNLTGTGEPQRLNGLRVSPNLGRVLGLGLPLGRDFTDEDGAIGNRRVLLAHHLWRQTFGSDAGVVGRSIVLDGEPHTIVGVLPGGLTFPDASSFSMPRQSDLWIAESWEGLRGDARGNQILRVIGVVAPGVTPQRMQDDLNRVADDFRRRFPARYSEKIGWRPIVFPFRDELVGESRPGLLLLLGAAALVVLVACANIAGLLLGREFGRRKELGIKSALGASRSRLVKDFTAEAFVLVALASAIAVGASWLAMPLLASAAPDTLPHVSEARLNAPTIAYAVALSVIVILTVGLVPAFRITSTDVSSSLRERSARAESGAWRMFRTGLIVAEVALAFIVVVLAGLLLRTVRNLDRADIGFGTRGLMATRIALPPARYPQPEHRAAFFDSLLQGLEAQPAVAAVALADPLPLSGEAWSGTVTIEGRPVVPGEPQPHAEYYRVSHGYFATLQIPMRAGREFLPSDHARAPLVVVVDEMFARQYWPGESALGKRVKVRGPGAPWATVVGVAGHVRRDGPRHTGEPQIYLPYAQSRAGMMNVVVRLDAETSGVAKVFRQAAAVLDPGLPVTQIVSLEARAGQVTAADRFNLLLVLCFACCALLLAAVGLYGLVSYLVTHGTREIGIRIALGSTPGALVRRAVLQGVIWAIGGVALGTLGALAIGKLVASLLFGVEVADVATLTTSATATIAIALAAAYAPARRIAGMDPVAAMRE